ncbi:hypothetical protein C8R45DRAFT_950166 [Mycena sanguinolenta]|nr:hypothetical protein C8R45DRAFT_950166 [Mycena sanguinolenta]
MSSPPAKRQRTDENAPVTRSERWFFDDGNVVLQAGNIQFRVHWSILALHSSVFRDMQGLPQPPDQPTVDGCPMVELSDDPDDVEYFLKALYIPMFHCQQTLPLAVVSAFIRLGRKYDFKELFDSAVARLTSMCPMTLEEYDVVSESDRLKTIEGYSGLTIDLISLASENNVLSVLPCAYYCALHLHKLGSLFDGIRRGDGTLASLSSLDLRRCVVAREKLFSKQFRDGYTLGWLRKGSDFFNDCTSSVQCRGQREALLTAFLEARLVPLLLPTAVSRLGLCPACTQQATESMAAGRKKMWEEFPGIFELPPWSELKNEI